MKKALIVIDMQKDFLTGSLANPQAERVIENVKAKVQSYRKNGDSVIFTRDTHFDDYLTTQEGKNLPVPHCIKGTDGWEIIPGLALSTDEIFDKPTFGSVELVNYVQEQGFDSVELVGVCTDICVVSNALLIKTFCLDTVVSVDGSCCAGVSEDGHKAALQTMASCQVLVKNANN